MRVTRQVDRASNGVRLTVHVKPLSSETKLLCDPDGTLTMHVAAPPAKGKANREIVKWMCKKLRRPSSHVRIVVGLHSNSKVIEILGINEEGLATALGIASRRRVP